VHVIASMSMSVRAKKEGKTSLIRCRPFIKEIFADFSRLTDVYKNVWFYHGAHA